MIDGPFWYEVFTKVMSTAVVMLFVRRWLKIRFDPDPASEPSSPKSSKVFIPIARARYKKAP